MGVLAHVGQALRHHVVGSDLDRLGQPFVEVDDEIDWHRRARDELLECHREPVGAHDRRVEATREVAELVERCRHLAAGVAEPTARGRIVVAEVVLEPAEVERQGDEALLGAVVQVAFESLALRLLCLHDTSTRFRELVDPRA